MIILILSSRSLFKSDYLAHVYNRNEIAAIHTDGLWSFPSNLDEGLQDCKRYKTSEAIEMIEMLAPDVMVQHMQCNKRHIYSALFEILGIPFIGSDSQVSANIVDKGKDTPHPDHPPFPPFPNTILHVQVRPLTAWFCFNFYFCEVWVAKLKTC